MPALGRKSLALLLTAALLFSLIGTAAAEPKPAGPPASPFWDTVGATYQQAVDSLYALGVVSGKTSTAYAAKGTVTRGELLTMAVKALGLQSRTPAAPPFPDVPVSHPAAPAIASAVSAGLLKLDPLSQLGPDDTVKFPEAVATLIRVTGLDSQAGSYPTGHVLLAKDLGLLEGLDFAMDKDVTRGDLAIMLYRTIFNVKRGGSGPTLSQSVFKRVGSVAIAPGGDAIPTGTVSLSAKVLDWTGNELGLPVTWSVASGSAVISSAGVLTVNGEGSVTVTATAGGVSVSKIYTVVKSLTIMAESTAVKAGSQVRLTAAALTGAGREVAVQPAWAVVDGDGSVTADGLLTASGPRSVTVKATLASLTDQVKVNIVSGITISPTNPYVAANGELQFTATVTDATGSRVEAPVVWSVTGGGSIDQSGKFHAGNSPATVTVRSGDSTASTTVQLVNRLEVSPNGAVLRKGDSQQFTATVYTTDNRVVTVPVTWSVTNTAVAFVSADGKLFASNSGSAFVEASYGGLKTQVPLTVAGLATGIQVTASPTSVPANGSSKVTLTARLVDAADNTASGADTILFGISSSKLGTLEKSSVKVENGVATTTLTVGTQAGTYAIMASAPGTSITGGTMSFTTSAPSLSHIVLVADPNPVAADGVSQTTITAKLIDQTGGEMQNNTGKPITVMLSANNYTAGRLLNAIISIGSGQRSGSVMFKSSGQIGDTIVSGTSTYLVYPVTVSSRTVGPAQRLKIKGNVTSVKADGTSEIELKVEVQDANGLVRTSENNTMIAMSAVSGTNSIGIASQQTKWGVASFKLRTTKAGTYTVRVWSLNTGLETDTAEVTFTAGTPYRLDLKVEPATTLAADGVSKAILRARILDANGNVVPTATNMVTFERVFPSALVTNMPSTTTVAAINGEATLELTARTGLGTDQFKATADALVESQPVSISTRITGVPVRVQIQPLVERTITAGNITTVKVWVVDAVGNGQLVTGDNGRMVYLYGTNGAEISPPTPTVNGVATFTVSNTKSGDIGLTATADGLESDNNTKVLKVTPAQPDHIILSATPEALSADVASRSYIKATLVDRYENPTVGSYPVTLSLSTTEFISLSGANVTTGGQTSVTAKGTPGTTTIYGTSGGYVVTPLTITTYRSGVAARVILDPIKTVQAGDGATSQVVVKARIVDENGNLVTSLNTGSDLTAMGLRIDGSTGTNSTTVTQYSNYGLASYGYYTNGRTMGSAQVIAGVATFTVTNTKAETIQLTPVVFYKGVQLVGQSGTMTTTAGPVNRLTVTSSAAAVLSSSPTVVTVTASLTDAYGNLASTATDTISFTANSLTYASMPSQTTVNTVNGSATVTLTTKNHSTGGTTIITASSSRTGLIGTATLVTDRLPDKPTVTARDINGSSSVVTSGEIGAKITVVVSARRSNQQVIVYVDGVAVPLYDSDDFTTADDTIEVGGTTLVAYVKRADLGGRGVKDVRAVVLTPLGMSPMSDGSTLTVQ